MATRLKTEAPEEQEPPKPVAEEPKRRRSVRTLLAGLIAVALLFGAAVGYERASAAHLFPDTRISGVGVGSLTSADAEARLTERLIAPLHSPITIAAPDYEVQATPWEMGLRLDVAQAVRDKVTSQRSEGLFSRIWHRVFGTSSNADLVPVVDEAVFAAFIDHTVASLEREPVDARLEIAEDGGLHVVPHQIGRHADRVATEERILAGLLEGTPRVDIPAEVVEPALLTESFHRVIVVNRTSNRLTLYEHGEVARDYPVATGKRGYATPRGQWRITAKRRNPTWGNPGSAWAASMPRFIPPGPNNPLGTRALNLNARGIRIHGTSDVASIGTHASHGCIRMLRADVEELFEIVDVGTPVLVV